MHFAGFISAGTEVLVPECTWSWVRGQECSFLGCSYPKVQFPQCRLSQFMYPESETVAATEFKGLDSVPLNGKSMFTYFGVLVYVRVKAFDRRVRLF